MGGREERREKVRSKDWALMQYDVLRSGESEKDPEKNTENKQKHQKWRRPLKAHKEVWGEAWLYIKYCVKNMMAKNLTLDLISSINWYSEQWESQI